MRYKILALLLSISTITAATLPKSISATLSSVKGYVATVEKRDLIPGMSGIVIHKYDENHEAIVATAKVLNLKGSQATLQLYKFDAISNSKLPNIKTKPQVGDRVILGNLYKRVLPIVPNIETYEKVKNSLQDIMLIHPDIFAAELTKEKEPLPKVENFRNICKKMSIGLVLFVFRDGSDLVDCASWQKVYHLDLSSVNKDLVTPFYHRIGEIPSPIYDWSDHALKDFDSYYKGLEN